MRTRFSLPLQINDAHDCQIIVQQFHALGYCFHDDDLRFWFCLGYMELLIYLISIIDMN